MARKDWPLQRQAYKRLFNPTCDTEGCRRLASYEVVGTHGTVMGQHCEEHADNRLRILGVDPKDFWGR